MKPRTQYNSLQCPLRSLLAAMLLCVALLVAANALEAKSFASPGEAVDALVSAVKSGDTDAIIAVLGPGGRELASSGDPVADEAARTRFLTAYNEVSKVRQVSDARAVLVIGSDDFPFPIPIVAKGGAWHFDTAEGAEEILDRRIGTHEIAAIEVLHAYVDAQNEYAEADRDGKGVQYARKLLSSEGKTDGLYWPTVENDPESPFGPLVAEARAEGYKRRAGGPTPYHGYLFRILTAQGKNAKGGARDYIVGDRMIGGFGLVAAPAEYGNSGVMTFIVNQDGVVYQKDLGPTTTLIGGTMRVFDPDRSWREIGRD